MPRWMRGEQRRVLTHSPCDHRSPCGRRSRRPCGRRSRRPCGRRSGRGRRRRRLFAPAKTSRVIESEVRHCAAQQGLHPHEVQRGAPSADRLRATGDSQPPPPPPLNSSRSVLAPVTLSARYFPLRSSYTTSYSTVSPSLRQLPSVRTLTWQNTSSPPPSSGLMKPKPRGFHLHASPLRRPPPPPPPPPPPLPRERERERERGAGERLGAHVRNQIRRGEKTACKQLCAQAAMQLQSRLAGRLPSANCATSPFGTLRQAFNTSFTSHASRVCNVGGRGRHKRTCLPDFRIRVAT